jgi:tungstate transport system ATP-binding protein
MHGPTSILPLTVSNLRYSTRDAELIRGMSFTLGAGTRSVIMGPNGAGKSLTLRLCHGLLRPTAGRIDWAAPGAAAGTPWCSSARSCCGAARAPT